MPADTLDALRLDPREWRARGLTPPGAIDALVHARLHGKATVSGTELSYADFFAA